MTKDRNHTPLPPIVERNLTTRVSELEEDQGKLLGEVSALTTWKEGAEQRIEEHETALDALGALERPSQADLSLHPNRARVSLKGISSRVVLVVFVTAIVCVAGVVVVWLLTK
jgi:hypothetical protein